MLKHIEVVGGRVLFGAGARTIHGSDEDMSCFGSWEAQRMAGPWLTQHHKTTQMELAPLMCCSASVWKGGRRDPSCQEVALRSVAVVIFVCEHL
jgi:hypothetical protein